MLNLIVLKAIFATSICFSAPQPSVLGYSDLVNSIEQRRQSGKPFGSINELLTTLPTIFKETFTLLKTSNSLQDARWSYPRVLMFNESMVLTFNGDPSQKGYSSLEVMSFDYNENVFKFNEIREVIKVGGVSQLEYSKTPPQKCLGCHGSNPMPIWVDYPIWNKAYGGIDDTINGLDKGDITYYPQFIKTKNSVPRYQKLVFPEGSPVSPYDVTVPHNYKFRPNFLLTKYVVNTNALRIQNIFESQRDYKVLQYALWLGLNEVRASNEGKQNLCIDMPDYPQALEKISKVVSLPVEKGRILDTLMTHWNLKHESLVMNDPYTDVIFEKVYWDGQFSQYQLVLALQLEKASKTDPILRQVLNVVGEKYVSKYSQQPLLEKIDNFRKPLLVPANGFCELLLKRIHTSQ